MNAFLVFGLILCSSPFVFSIKCQVCGDEGPCNEANAKTIDCSPLMADRCMTMVLTMTVPNVGPVTQTNKNCSFSMVCQDQSQANPCTQLASQPTITACKVTCCEGDLCNKATPPPDTPTVAPTPTSTVSAITASADTPVPTGAPSVTTTNVSAVSNTTTEPPSAGAPEFTITFGAIFLGLVMASLATLA